MRYLFLVVLVLAIFCLLFPRRVPRLLLRLGRSLGGAGRMGQEIVTGDEVEGSPLARLEVQAGEVLARKILAANPPTQDRALQNRVEAIGARLAEHALRRQIPYRFLVVESAEPNAFAISGGTIAVTRPLVELCASDNSRLAGVLGHEFVHVDRRHALNQLAAQTALKAGVRVVSLLRGHILSRAASAMEQFIVQGYSQEQELEADALGMRVAVLAGFRPEGLIELLEALGAVRPESEGPLADLLSYLRSHPPIAVRVRHLREKLPRQ